MVSQSQAHWPTVPISARDVDGPLFFTDDEWTIVRAATARIIPTDYDPGAAEADVVRFLDRFLSGDFVYASATGDGFLEIRGKEAEAWQARIRHRQSVYREGLASLKALSLDKYAKDFHELSDDEQDALLVETSGRLKPRHVQLHDDEIFNSGEGGPPPTNQPVSDSGLGFFDMLVAHTRQGFYADPVYGGNKDFVGWRVIGFDGPKSLADTVAGRYTTTDYMIMGATWPYPQSPRVQRFGR